MNKFHHPSHQDEKLNKQIDSEKKKERKKRTGKKKTYLSCQPSMQHEFCGLVWLSQPLNFAYQLSVMIDLELCPCQRWVTAYKWTLQGSLLCRTWAAFAQKFQESHQTSWRTWPGTWMELASQGFCWGSGTVGQKWLYITLRKRNKLCQESFQYYG